MFRILIFCLLPAGIATPLRAGLEWSPAVLELAAQSGDDTVEGVVEVRNAGTTPVTVRHLLNSCGCTSSRLEPDVLQAGGTARLSVVFNVGDRRGLQRKAIEIRTDEPAKYLVPLYVSIEDVADLDRSILLWKSDEPASAQKTRLKVIRAEPLRIVRVESSDPAFRAELAPIEPGREYEVTVTPSAPLKKGRATITLFSDASSGTPMVFKVRARVK